MKYLFRGFTSPSGAKGLRSPDELDRFMVRQRLALFKSIHQMRRYRWRLICSLIVLCALSIIWFLPLPDETQAIQTIHQHQATVMTGLQKVCDQPTKVFQVFGYPSSRVPAKALLARLPTPTQLHLQKQGDMTYDPAKNVLCTVGWTGIYTRFIQPAEK
ncbi:hypothetical protein KDA_65720 [Dictyobacter alpinus]|uniref:Uncharacterized protein n=1 Tax=Dictyobacter alpinus TaxID=2014873 RepID=A0A402BI57_9CHLR|nr:hypothetical protein [Dictyobacter alpinus]GCE31088.1 hypothetical protein KDA_65720 [Dictyobacter alpinus]